MVQGPKGTSPPRHTPCFYKERGVSTGSGLGGACAPVCGIAAQERRRRFEGAIRHTVAKRPITKVDAVTFKEDVEERVVLSLGSIDLTLLAGRVRQRVEILTLPAHHLSSLSVQPSLVCV